MRKSKALPLCQPQATGLFNISSLWVKPHQCSSIWVNRWVFTISGTSWNMVKWAFGIWTQHMTSILTINLILASKPVLNKGSLFHIRVAEGRGHSWRMTHWTRDVGDHVSFDLHSLDSSCFCVYEPLWMGKKWGVRIPYVHHRCLKVVIYQKR